MTAASICSSAISAATPVTAATAAVESGARSQSTLEGGTAAANLARAGRGSLALDAAGTHRAIIATMVLSGLRVSEMCGLRSRAVDLARGALVVEDSKTDAGTWRKVDLTPELLDELKVHRQSAQDANPDDYVFPTQTGGRRDRNNVRSRILMPALAHANAARTKTGPAADPARDRTHAAADVLLAVVRSGRAAAVHDGADGPHERELALEVYAKRMQREPGTGKRVDALIRNAEGARSEDNLLVGSF